MFYCLQARQGSSWVFFQLTLLEFSCLEHICGHILPRRQSDRHMHAKEKKGNLARTINLATIWPLWQIATKGRARERKNVRQQWWWQWSQRRWCTAELSSAQSTESLGHIHSPFARRSIGRNIRLGPLETDYGDDYDDDGGSHPLSVQQPVLLLLLCINIVAHELSLQTHRIVVVVVVVESYQQHQQCFLDLFSFAHFALGSAVLFSYQFSVLSVCVWVYVCSLGAIIIIIATIEHRRILPLPSFSSSVVPFTHSFTYYFALCVPSNLSLMSAWHILFERWSHSVHTMCSLALLHFFPSLPPFSHLQCFCASSLCSAWPSLREKDLPTRR